MGKVKIRMVSMVAGLKRRSYQEKLEEELGLQTPETRRKRYDMTHTYKILKVFDKVESSIWFETIGIAPSRQRQSSYPLNLVRKPNRTDIRNNFFKAD